MCWPPPPSTRIKYLEVSKQHIMGRTRLRSMNNSMTTTQLINATNTFIGQTDLKKLIKCEFHINNNFFLVHFLVYQKSKFIWASSIFIC